MNLQCKASKSGDIYLSYIIQQVQDFKPSVAHLYPNTGRVPSLHFHDSSTSEIPSLFILQHGLTWSQVKNAGQSQVKVLDRVVQSWVKITQG